MVNIDISKRKITLNWGIGLPTKYSIRYGVEVNGLMTNVQTISSNVFNNDHVIEITGLNPQTKYMLDAALFNEQEDIVETLSKSVETYANINIDNFVKSTTDSSATIQFTTSVPTTMEVRVNGVNIVLYKTEVQNTNYDFTIGSLKDSKSYDFVITLYNDSNGYFNRSVSIKTRPNVYSKNLITEPYMHILNAINSIGAKVFLSTWSNVLRSTPLTDFVATSELLTAEQLILFNNKILELYIDSSSNSELFVRNLIIWLEYDNIQTALTRKQKKAILLSTKAIADNSNAIVYKKAIKDNIEKMNNFGLISVGSKLIDAYLEITGTVLQLKTLDYSNELK